jgi:hypothetical protein
MKGKLVMAKELVDLFAQQGVFISYRYARALLARCPQTVRGRYIHFDDAWTWWVLNPGFRPFGEKPGNSSLADTL